MNAGPVLAQQSPAPVPAQEPPAELALSDLAGRPRSLDDLRGKIVVLNFWATWCVPCREEMPLLVSAQKRYALQGVEVIGASADDEKTQDHIAPFVKKLKINFAVWRGATTADMQRLGLGAALPATAFLDRDGRIVYRILGPLTASDLEQRIEWLLGRGRGAPPAPVTDNFTKQPEHAEGEGHKHTEGEDHIHGTGTDAASSVPS